MRIELGMAIQAFVTAILMRSNTIDVSPIQQFIAGIFFLVVGGINLALKEKS